MCVFGCVFEHHPPSVLRYQFPRVSGCIGLILMYSFLMRASPPGKHTHLSDTFTARKHTDTFIYHCWQTSHIYYHWQTSSRYTVFPPEKIRYQPRPETNKFQLFLTPNSFPSLRPSISVVFFCFRSPSILLPCHFSTFWKMKILYLK